MRRTYFFRVKNIAAATIIGFAAVTGGPALAQVAPSAAEVAAYTGLHAAAQKGDVTKADLNARDGNGRTPLQGAGNYPYLESKFKTRLNLGSL